MKRSLRISTLLFLIILASNISAENTFEVKANTYDIEKSHAVNDLYCIILGGGGTVSDKLSLGFDIMYVHKHHVFTFGVVGNSNRLFREGESIDDVHFLYGQCIRTKLAVFSLSAGVGYTKGLKTETDGFGPVTKEEKIGPCFGVPIQAQVLLRPGQFFGVGLKAYGNLNSGESFIGGQFTLFLGKVWDRRDL